MELGLIHDFLWIKRGISIDNVVYGDPWMQDLKVREQLKRLAAEENKFNSSMMEFHKELVKIDSFLTESLKEIFVEHSKGMQEHADSDQQTITTLNQRVTLINPTEEFVLFAKKNGLDDLAVWQK